MDQEEHTVNLLGIDLAYISCGPADAPAIVCLHGWLDNAASFEQLAPIICASHRVYLVDLPGHGKSGQRPPSGTYNIFDDLPTLLLFANTVVKRERFVLMGHSRGAVISVLLAAALGASRVERLVLLDGMTPGIMRDDAVAEQLGRFAADYIKPRVVYPAFQSFADVVELRRVTTHEPYEVAEPLMRRNYDPVTRKLRTDERLHHNSAMKACATARKFVLSLLTLSRAQLTRSMVTSVLGKIDVPVLLFVASQGSALYEDRTLTALVKKLQRVDVQGMYHVRGQRNGLLC